MNFKYSSIRDDALFLHKFLQFIDDKIFTLCVKRVITRYNIVIQNAAVLGEHFIDFAACRFKLIRQRLNAEHRKK